MPSFVLYHSFVIRWLCLNSIDPYQLATVGRRTMNVIGDSNVSFVIGGGAPTTQGEYDALLTSVRAKGRRGGISQVFFVVIV